MSLIKKLADLVGFYQSYFDSFGRNVTANEEALSVLLTAMGYDLSSDDKIVESINCLVEKPWREMLDPTVIIKAEQQDGVMISLPISDVINIEWRIALEGGEELQGNEQIDALALIEQHQIAEEHFARYQLPLPELEQGYHQLTVSNGKTKSSSHIIVAPQTCFNPKEATSDKIWGYAAQLYSLRSENNWGLGDFGDLNKLVKKSAVQGASLVGLNPLHPLYLNNPAHRSPYSPTSRCYLNVLYIDVLHAPGFSDSAKAQDLVNNPIFKQQLAEAKQSELIDYPAVAALKFPILEQLYQDFLSDQGSDAFLQFTVFKKEQGKDLSQLSTFEALYEYFRAIDNNAYGWSAWPVEYQSPDSSAVIEFQQQHSDRIDYFSYLQWIAHYQLSQVTATAKEHDMPVGLYLDLAVGCDGSGVDVWSNKDVYVAGASVGAPPDALNNLGQDWGLTPMNPVSLQEKGFVPLVKALRSNMQYAGALRIDHIIGLMRQYWVAPGLKADEGVFITFPLDAILRVIALESRRNNCIVIGEDLGTVPDGFGDIMENAGLLSYKVLFFERWWESGLFKRPDAYPELAMVTVSTHDLSTLAGWWQGVDLEWRQRLNLYPTEEMGVDERAARIDDRVFLLDALQDLGVITQDNSPSLQPPIMNHALAIAVQTFLAQANSRIQLIPLEDALESIEQVNIPGTVDEHPNWCKKLAVPIEEFCQTPSIIELARAMQAARPRS